MFGVWLLCCFVVLSVLSSFTIISFGKIELGLLLIYGHLCSVSLPYSDMGWSAMCECGIFRSYHVLQFKPLSLMLILIAYSSDKGSGNHAHFQSL